MLLKAVVMHCSWRETCKTRFTGQRETGKFEQDKHERLTCCACEVNRLNCKLVDSRSTWHRENAVHKLTGTTTSWSARPSKKLATPPCPPTFIFRGRVSLVYSLRYSNREPDGQTDIKVSIKNFILPTTRSNYLCSHKKTECSYLPCNAHLPLNWLSVTNFTWLTYVTVHFGQLFVFFMFKLSYFPFSRKGEKIFRASGLEFDFKCSS